MTDRITADVDPPRKQPPPRTEGWGTARYYDSIGWLYDIWGSELYARAVAESYPNAVVFHVPGEKQDNE